MNIRVDLNYAIKDGTEVVFRSPVDCSQVTGLKVYYAEDGISVSKEFALADAHGNNVGDIDHLFAENVVVKVILDVSHGMAYVQNADTNAYIERTFVKTVNGIAPDVNGNVVVSGGSGGGSGGEVFVPKAQVTQTANGATITVTDQHGTSTATITNGKSAHEYAKDGGYTGTEAEFSAKLAQDIPVKVSQLENDSGYLTKHQSLDGYAKTEDIPTKPEDIGALPNTYTPPNQTAEQVGADPKGAAASAVSQHNTATGSHNDIRLELKAINDRLTAFFDSDDQTLDELSEIVAYITSNKSLIDSITTSKVSVADIINNLTTNVTNKPLSAAQGVALKALIDAITVPTKVSQLTNDKGYLTQHQDISGKLDVSALQTAIDTALAQAKASGEFDGVDGVSPTVAVSKSGKVTTVSITDKNGTKTATINDGADGKDYVLTPADKAEIAEQVENATIVQAPKYVNSVEEMTDPNRPYVLISTGRIWANAETTVEKEVTKTDTITSTTENPYVDGNRLNSSTTDDTFSTDATGYHLTPKIDLTKEEYQGKTVQIHLEGAQYASTGAYATWIMARTYGTDGAIVQNRVYTCDTNLSGAGLIDGFSGALTVTYNSATSATVTVSVPPAYGSAKIPIGYLRFCGKGAVADSKISITYQAMETTTGVQWFDTGTTYAPTLTAEEKQAMVDEVAEMVDAQLLNIIGDGVVTV